MKGHLLVVSEKATPTQSYVYRYNAKLYSTYKCSITEQGKSGTKLEFYIPVIQKNFKIFGFFKKFS